MQIDELRRRFDVPGVSFVAGRGGLACVQVDTPACRGELFLQGAHVTRWQPAGHEPVLWVSARSAFAPGKAIRGGVPICFPWFGPAGEFVQSRDAAPMHGHARTEPWTPTDIRRHADDVIVTLAFGPVASLTPHWPAQFDARLTARFGATLDLSLSITNRQSTPITFEAALHTYFCVDDVHHTSVTGLANTRYLDKAGDTRVERFQDGHPIRFAAETDRVYQDTTQTCVIDDGVRRIENHKRGSKTTVVWNPWIAKAQAIGLADGEWQDFVCVETAAALDNAITLPAGASHEIAARLVVSKS
jgi:glucose-6-phosphate 1-epimerase